MAEISQRPTGNGSVDQLTGGYADVSDDNDSTKLVGAWDAWYLDLFTFADPTGSIPEGATIDSVQVIARVASEYAGDFDQAKAALKIGGTIYYASVQYFYSSTYANLTFTWTTDPSTSAEWDPDDLASFEAGIAMNGGYSGHLTYCSEIWRKINYTEAASGVPKHFAYYQRLRS